MSASGLPRSLGGLFARHRGRIVLTYLLFNVENVLMVFQPLMLGWAINGLLEGHWTGVAWFAGQHITHALLGAGRRAYDTRAYTAIYNELVGPLILAARRGGQPTSLVAARASLSRELVDFFELHIPIIIACLYGSLGALLMLVVLDPIVAGACLLLLLPVTVVQTRCWGELTRLNARIHDRLEREVDVIETAHRWRVFGHFGLLRRWRVRVSDIEMRNFALTEMFVLGLIVFALVRFCAVEQAAAGDIFAQLLYVVTFVAALDQGPLLVQQIVRVRDIQQRLADPTEAAPAR